MGVGVRRFRYIAKKSSHKGGQNHDPVRSYVRRNTFTNRKGKQIMHIATVLAVALLGTTSLAGAEHAQAAIQHYQLNIPRQSLDTALKDLAEQTGLQIGRFSGRIDGSAMVGPVKGDQTPEQALKILLNKTGLDYKIVSDTTIAVYNPADTTSAQFNSPPHGSGEGSGGEASSQGVKDQKGEEAEKGSQSQGGDQKKSFWGRFRLAQVDQGKTPPVDSSSKGSSPASGERARRADEDSSKIPEIIVTAQKRSERIQDVPVPVTSIDANQLVENNQVRFEDYYTSVPGLSFAPNNQNNYLAIRGIATGGFSNPTVGIVIDEVPFGASTALGGGQVVPDLDPGDLARVEVLRGPQGTLYGASSMGGLLKFVTVDPSTDALSGRVQVGFSDVHNGAQLGYNVRASVNVPINDTLAITASGFTRQDPGYIDNPVYHLDGVNETRVIGGRLAALWQPADVVSVKLSALYQDSRLYGAPQISVLPG